MTTGDATNEESSTFKHSDYFFGADDWKALLHAQQRNTPDKLFTGEGGA
jgi:hypothetical protein